jgi:LPS export ABC transporter permease LptF/LPS export ABC transporter permease LptG
MRTLDRYVIREVLAPFALALLVLTFLLIIPFIIEQAENMVAKGVPWPIIFQTTVTLVPQALGLTIPMSLLVGLLVALGRLSGDREVVAMQACGLSPARLLRPAGLLAIVAWAATSWVLIEAIPDANQTFREITSRLVADRAESEVKPRVFFQDFPGFVVYVRDIPPDGGWSGVLAADTRNPEQTIYYLAKRGRMLVDRDRRVIQLVLTDGTRHSTSTRDAAGYEVVRFAETIVPLDPETVFPRTGPARGDRELTLAELRARAAELEAKGESSHNQQLEIHTKFSIPVACLVFALIGVALGATDRRDGKFASFVLGLGVIFAYYTVMFTGQSLAKGQYVSPGVARWLPNVVLGIAGAIALWRRMHPVRRAGGGMIRHLVTRLAARRAARGGTWMPRIPDVPWLRPPLLDLYVGTLYLRVLALCVAGMLGLFYLATFIDLSEKLFKGTATTAMMLEYLWWSTPQFLYYTVALAVLMAAVVTVGALTKSSELIVMRACGISLYRTAVPLVAAALVAAAGLFALEERLLAPANRRAKTLDYRIRGQEPRMVDFTRRWFTGEDGRIYHYSYYNADRRELGGLTVLTVSDDASVVRERSFARVATATTDTSVTPAWDVRQAWTRTFAEDAAVASYTPVDEGQLTLVPPDAFLSPIPRPEQMTYGELAAYIASLRASGTDVREHEVSLHRKIAFPFVTLVMTLIGVPFAVTTGRRGALYGVGVGIVLALVYWTMISVFAAFGAGGLLPPVMAAWAPNAIFGACAVYLLLTVRT